MSGEITQFTSLTPQFLSGSRSTINRVASGDEKPKEPKEKFITGTPGGEPLQTPVLKLNVGSENTNGADPIPVTVEAKDTSATPVVTDEIQAPEAGFKAVSPLGALVTLVDANPVTQTDSPDLLALSGVQTASSTEKPGFVNPLAGVSKETMGPLGDILELSTTATAGEVKEALCVRQPEIHKWATHHKTYNKELDLLLYEHDSDGNMVYDDETNKPKQKDLPVEVLRAFEAHWTEPNPPAGTKELIAANLGGTGENKGDYPVSDLAPEDKKMHADQMTQLLVAYKDRGHWDDVSRFYEKMRGVNPELGKYEIPREYYIVSLNKQKRIKESINESEALINERVEAVNHGPMGFIEASRRNMYRSLGINGEVLAGMGKAYKVVHQQAEKQIDEKVANADFGALFAQLTQTDQADWKIGDSTVGEVANKKAGDRFSKRFGEIMAKDDAGEASKELLDFVEKATGTNREAWSPGEGGSEGLYAQLKGSENPIATVEKYTGTKLEGWAFRQEAVAETASAPLNKVAGKVVRGIRKRDDLNALAKEMTGTEVKGQLAKTAVSGKMDELLESVTTRGNLDEELVDRVSNNSSTPVGKNLLKASRKALEVSRDYYLAGFGVDVEYYPGINVVYNELNLGNHKSAKGLIPIVQYAVMREGGETATDYWSLATQMELGAIGDQPKTVHDLLPRLFTSAKAGWELDITASNLEDLAEKRRDDGQDASLIDFVTKKFRERQAAGFPASDDFSVSDFVTKAQKELAATHDVSGSPPVLTAEEQTRKEATDKILSKAKHFQNVFTSKFVGGSWKFVSRGGVSDRPINRQTVRALREVNKHLGLDDLKGPDDFPVFHDLAVRYIDAKFDLIDELTQVRHMEDLGSETHHKRDTFTQSRHDVFHSRTSGSADTNLAVEIMLGQSDCRDTDATYQVMFDLWKRDQQTQHLQSAIDAVIDGHESLQTSSMDKANDWDGIQVVSMDLAFNADVHLKVGEDGEPMKYKIERDDQGRMIRRKDGDFNRWSDGSVCALEDHSMPFLLKLDDKGLIKSAEEDGMRAVDPFYQDFWQLGNLPVDPLGILSEKGLALGVAGVPADDNKPVELFGTPTRYSGAAPQDIRGEAGQVKMGGLEVAMNDLSPLLSENNELSHLTEAITGMVTGNAKARVLNAVMSRMLNQAAKESHTIWYRSKSREVMDPKSPFLGAAPEKVAITKEAKAMERPAFESWIQDQAPEGFDIPKWKMDALHEAPEGAVVFDPAFQTYAEMLDSGKAVRRTGEAAVAPLATALYLQDFRHNEDLSFVLENILDGTDKKGKEELEKVNRVAYLASQITLGERAYDNTISVMENTDETKSLQGRKDFHPWHQIDAEDPVLAGLDAYTLQPAAEWMMAKLDDAGTNSGRAILEQAIGDMVEAGAERAHNVGWKTSKDDALANPADPFVGWASVRNRISSNTPEVADMSREQIAEFYSIPVEQISETKAEAIREATRKAVAEGKTKGSDITHTLYKPYKEVAAEKEDGGTRFVGQNSVPLMTLALYLSDWRGSETDSAEGLKQVLQGLADGSDKEGLKTVSMLNHVAFQAAQLTQGERSFETQVPVQRNTGETTVVKGNASMALFDDASEGDLANNAAKAEASTLFLQRDLKDLVEH